MTDLQKELARLSALEYPWNVTDPIFNALDAELPLSMDTAKSAIAAIELSLVVWPEIPRFSTESLPPILQDFGQSVSGVTLSKAMPILGQFNLEIAASCLREYGEAAGDPEVVNIVAHNWLSSTVHQVGDMAAQWLQLRWADHPTDTVAERLLGATDQNYDLIITSFFSVAKATVAVAGVRAQPFVARAVQDPRLSELNRHHLSRLLDWVATHAAKRTE